MKNNRRFQSNKWYLLNHDRGSECAAATLVFDTFRKFGYSLSFTSTGVHISVDGEQVTLGGVNAQKKRVSLNDIRSGLFRAVRTRPALKDLYNHVEDVFVDIMLVVPTALEAQVC